MLNIDLYAGLGGWSDGFLAEGFDCIGFDIERHDYGTSGYPGQLVLQDVRQLHGSQFKAAACIVASPPCTEYSYMAMPWSRGKQIARALRGKDEFPDDYTGSRTIDKLNELFNACFRIQREACEAAGRHIPMVVENVRGAIQWVGPAKANYGSFYLWGDIAMVGDRIMRPDMQGEWLRSFHMAGSGIKNPGMNWSKYGQPGYRAEGFNDKNEQRFRAGVKHSASKSDSRKAASAMIAKIPEPLSRFIARCYRPC